MQVTKTATTLMKLGLYILLNFCLCGWSAYADLLVDYHFDHYQIDTGPDTLRIFEYTKGSVRLSSEFRYSGFHSVQIQDYAQDGGFAELQGYFPMLNAGELQIQFTMMTPTPNESFNIALAGPAWFRLRPNGIGFWLSSDQGYLSRVAGKDRHRLFAIEPLVWYLVTLRYDIDAGRYDLRIVHEYQQQAIVDLRNVPNTNSTPGSKVYVFSFIGDLPDQQNALLFIDDLQIHSSESVSPTPLLAPGRRKLFIDFWREASQSVRKHPQCVATTHYSDLGFSEQDLIYLHQTKSLPLLQKFLRMPTKQISSKIIDSLAPSPRIQAVAAWRRGCGALLDRDSKLALNLFEQATQLVPQAPIYGLSRALALAARGHFNEADEQIASSYGEWYQDERFAAAQAMLAIARNEPWSAEQTLITFAHSPHSPSTPHLHELWHGKPNKELLVRLQSQYPNHWRKYLRERLITEQYYFLLLARETYADAYDYAKLIVDQLTKQGKISGVWHERQGNAAFLLQDYNLALAAYKRAIAANIVRGVNSKSVALKLSDLYFILGNPDKERHYREMVYGSLQQK